MFASVVAVHTDEIDATLCDRGYKAVAETYLLT